MSEQVIPRGATARFAAVVATAVLAFVGIAGGAALPSTALLTATAKVGASTVASGSVSLGLTNGAGSGTWTGSFSLVPGGAAYQRLTVTNLGSVGLRYAVTATSTTDTFASRLESGVAVLASGATTCDSSSYAAGALVSPSSALPFGSTAVTKVIGDPASGSQPGDRTLAGAAAEDLCLQVTFPFGSGVGYAGRGQTATTTFTFSAENSP
jgi:spore coat-associated protein N